MKKWNIMIKTKTQSWKHYLWEQLFEVRHRWYNVNWYTYDFGWERETERQTETVTVTETETGRDRQKQRLRVYGGTGLTLGLTNSCLIFQIVYMTGLILDSDHLNLSKQCLWEVLTQLHKQDVEIQVLLFRARSLKRPLLTTHLFISQIFYTDFLYSLKIISY